MSMHGKTRDRASIPAWLPQNLKDAAILTSSGWEIPAQGNDNPDAYELIVALGQVTIAEGNNDGPTLYEGTGRTTFSTLLGISGAAISTYNIQVFDLEQTVGDGLTTSAVSGIPTGLSLQTAGDYLFTLTGTPVASGTGTIGITFTDGNSLAYAEVPYTFTE